MKWTRNLLKYDGIAAYQKLKRRHTKISQKIALLTHDIAFRTPSKAQFFEAFWYDVSSAFDKLLPHRILTYFGSTLLPTYRPNQ